MRDRARLTGTWAALIWLVPALDLAALALLAVLLPRDPDPVFFLSFALWVASFGFVGGLIAIRIPGNAVGWILWVSATLVTVGLAGSDYAGYSAERLGGTLPLTVPVAWLSSWSFVVAIGMSLVFVPLLFPDGRLPSRRWRVVAVYGALATLGAASIAFRPGPLSNVHAIANPLGIPALGPLIDAVGFPPATPMILAIFLAFAAPIARFRHGGPVERRQVAWFGLVLAIVIVVFAVAPDELSFAGIVLLPIGIGIAILRYRLYEIDRIVSRTVAYAVITAILAVVFAAAVLVLQGLLALVAPLVATNTLAVVVSTILVATLFQPVRRRVQDATDRRFNRSRYDAARTVAALSDRLRGEVDLTGLTLDVVRVTTTAFEPTRASLWLRD